MESIDDDVPDPALSQPLGESPLPIIARWLREARESNRIRNHDAMALATVDARGLPQVRMVLCRGFDAERGHFSFYTNRESPKATQLEGAKSASCVFYWDALDRQVRISGPVEATSDRDSDAYFDGRHPLSQIAAWTSRQSQPIASRSELIARFEATARRFGGKQTSQPIPRPSHWGGYRLTAESIEIWAGRAGRLHDRAVWTRTRPTGWQAQRLQP